jgi:hypothetical protein
MNQAELHLIRRADSQSVSTDIILRRKDFLGAINLCIEVSGLDDKEIYIELQIDAAQWSRIRKGDAHFPPNKLQSLMSVCGNQVPLIWLARQYGYELVQIESETQRKLKLKEKELEDERLKNRVLMDALQGKR